MPVFAWQRVLPLVVAVIAVTVMLLLPGDTTPSGPPHSDKVTHALMFAVLAYCSRFARFSPAITLVGLAAYGALTEVLQATVAVRRSGSVWDWCADLFGILVGLAVAEALRRRTRAARAR
ncbi:VanZ family protein [Rhodococcus sp. (in: high G+C Gram-positive bacteria)]|uniref:VanZ family protein n=1 Tax=unclassified Rhodococcus (in: high G+C Gram-positive bacteria) TaxID=192944 RepID=UPI0019EF0A6F|nr:VanZ family protein [Rhodococcus sp. (in: high G+C Gram-positive bacteria)]MBF0660015.1 VanZ family protein [Rhodococcus sp. (in: high G+C Gram-positive bacteria)]